MTADDRETIKFRLETCPKGLASRLIA